MDKCNHTTEESATKEGWAPRDGWAKPTSEGVPNCGVIIPLSCLAWVAIIIGPIHFILRFILRFIN